MQSIFYSYPGGKRMSSNRWAADSILLSVAIVWGLTFVIIQDAIAVLPPFAFNAARFGFAAILLGIYIFFQSRFSGKIINFGIQIKYGIILGILLFAGYALQTYSLLYTTSGKSGFLTGLSVALVPFLAYIILRQKPSVPAMLGTFFAVIGLYLMAFSDLSSVHRGDLLAFSCAIAFGLQLVYTAKFSKESSTAILVFVQLITVAILNTGSAILFEKPISLHVFLDASVFWALIITSVFATVFAFIAQTFFIKFTSPAHVALIFATEPVFAAISDFAWNGIMLSSITLMGCLFILLGMILAEIPMSKSLLPHIKKRKENLYKNPGES